jgi:broad-specificity NMP kinase
MIVSCLRCGGPVEFRAPTAPCVSCDYEWIRLPFFAVSGASGVGKSTAARLLPRLLPDYVSLDGDILWRDEYLGSDEGGAYYYRTWLRMAINVAQNGRPLIFAGAVLPERWEPSPLRPYVTAIHYLALVADPDVHEARLRGRGVRPQDASNVEPSLYFNRWLLENAETTTPPMTLLDTTHLDPSETAERIAAWVNRRAA